MLEQTPTPRMPRIRVAALIQRKDTVLLVEHLKDGHHNFLLPGGGVAHGESLHEALIRELWEEARLHICPGKLLFISESIAPDGERHFVQIVFEAEADGEPTVGEDPRVVGCVFMPVANLLKLDMYPAIQDALTAGLRDGFDATPAYLGNLWRTLPDVDGRHQA